MNGRSLRDRRTTAVVGIGLLAAVGVFVVLFLTALSLGWDPGFSVQDIEGAIRSWGPWGVAASVGLMVLHSFLPFPAEFLALANGMVYGPVWGIAITWGGAMLGAFVAFGLARRLGRPFVEQMVARRDWQVLDDWAGRQGGAVVLIARFVPVIAFNLVNYAAGLTKISWWTFTWTTGVGILPVTALMVMMGDNIDTLAWEWWVLLLAGALALWFAVRRRLAISPLAPLPGKRGPDPGP
jgi:uncharacterized membrane protein YdjX (TVP38/TMEM64 family)